MVLVLAVLWRPGSWRPVASLSGVATALGASCAGATGAEDELMPALFGFQAVALVGYAALLSTPSRPVEPLPRTDA